LKKSENPPSPLLISIILCTYQGEKFLQTQLDSLLNQSYANIEILIFDDASSDTTTQIIEKYTIRYPNIYLFKNHQRLGFVKNFEKAITYWLKQNKSDYLALCDQDDLWHSNKLTNSMTTLQELEQLHPNFPALVHCDLRLINTKNQVIQPSFFAYKSLDFPDNKALGKLLGYNGVMSNTLLINRHLANICLPFPPQLKYHDYWISIINELFGVRKTIQQPLIDYRIHQENTSNNRQKQKSHWWSFSFERLNKKLITPFYADNRKSTISYVLQKFSHLNTNDQMLLFQFQRYLSTDMNHREALLFLFQNGFLKQGWKHKASVCFRILVTDKRH
jgi:glycosyltransferase involved in cell wall biosynthesis